MYQADHCDIFYEGGEQWCNFHGECEGENDLDALAMTPAGTYLVIGTQLSADGSSLVTACRKLVVTHLPKAGNAGPLILRI